ncbi:MAG: DUF4349 domain-containing protein [Saprospiraceae bacterium]
MKISALPAFFIVACLAVSCNRSAPEQSAKSAPASEDYAQSYEPEKAPATSPADRDYFSSVAAIGAADTIKTFVRKASWRFRAGDVQKTSLRIEDLARRLGGFVVSSDLNTQVERRHTEPVSRDSALETILFSEQHQIVLRLPAMYLDTLLRTAAAWADLTDYRRVSAEDVSLQLLEQQLTQLRQELYNRELQQSPEIAQAVAAAGDKTERRLRSRSVTDRARLERLKIEDAVRYSTVTIEMYDLPRLRRSMIAYADYDEPGRSFVSRAVEALRQGGELLVFISLGIFRLWGVILLAAVVFLIWRKWRPRRVKS